MSLFVQSLLGLNSLELISQSNYYLSLLEDQRLLENVSDATFAKFADKMEGIVEIQAQKQVGWRYMKAVVKASGIAVVKARIKFWMKIVQLEDKKIPDCFEDLVELGVEVLYKIVAWSDTRKNLTEFLQKFVPLVFVGVSKFPDFTLDVLLILVKLATSGMKSFTKDFEQLHELLQHEDEIIRKKVSSLLALFAANSSNVKEAKDKESIVGLLFSKSVSTLLNTLSFLKSNKSKIVVPASKASKIDSQFMFSDNLAPPAYLVLCRTSGLLELITAIIALPSVPATSLNILLLVDILDSIINFVESGSLDQFQDAKISSLSISMILPNLQCFALSFFRNLITTFTSVLMPVLPKLVSGTQKLLLSSKSPLKLKIAALDTFTTLIYLYGKNMLEYVISVSESVVEMVEHCIKCRVESNPSAILEFYYGNKVESDSKKALSTPENLLDSDISAIDEIGFAALNTWSAIIASVYPYLPKPTCGRMERSLLSQCMALITPNSVAAVSIDFHERLLQELLSVVVSVSGVESSLTTLAIQVFKKGIQMGNARIRACSQLYLNVASQLIHSRCIVPSVSMRPISSVQALHNAHEEDFAPAPVKNHHINVNRVEVYQITPQVISKEWVSGFQKDNNEKIEELKDTSTINSSVSTWMNMEQAEKEKPLVGSKRKMDEEIKDDNELPDVDGEDGALWVL